MSEPGKSPRQFSDAFKEEMVLRLEAGERIAAVAEEAGVKRKLLYEWRDVYRAMGVAGFNRKRGPKPGWKERRASGGCASSLRTPSRPPRSPRTN
jgi:transposase-like protein